MQAIKESTLSQKNSSKNGKYFSSIFRSFYAFMNLTLSARIPVYDNLLK